MKVNRISTVYFSPAGSTKKITTIPAEHMGEAMKIPTTVIDVTCPKSREKHFSFQSDELTIFGFPTYAGRIPNKILPFLKENFKGDNSPAIAMVSFGNRNFDSSLTELQEELLKNGFRVFAAGAFSCRHVFSKKIAPGRPDDSDISKIKNFANMALSKLESAEKISDLTVPIIKNDAPLAPYYTPLGTDGLPAKFLKAKPKTDTNKCDNCGICAKVCPLGSIEKSDVTNVSVICIKCCACILKCPQNAKYFDDKAFLSHVKMLEKNYSDRKEPEIFI